MKHYNLIVIGGDGAGMGAASQARRIKKDMSIAVFERDNFVSYAACGMPYYISDDVKDHNELLAIDPEEFISKRNIDIRRGSEVTSVDFSSKSLQVSENGIFTDYSYDKLVIATGASAVLPPIKGIENPSTFVLRTLQHGLDIKEKLEKGNIRKAVLIGGGFISIELAESFIKKGIETVLLEKEESVAALMSPEIRNEISAKLTEKGVNIVTGVNISEIVHDEQRTLVKTDRGEFEADIVIASTGVRPSTGFLRDSGLEMFPNGAIIVDEKSRTNIEDVYAAGDCATVNNLITGKADYIPMATTANKQGRVAGLQAAGVSSEKFRGSVGSQFLRVCDLQIGKTGFNKKDAEKHGINVTENIIEWKTKPGYCPDNMPILVKLTVNSDTGTIAGGEIAGKDGAVLRLNTIAAAITAGMKIEDLAYLDTGYAPPFSPVWDPVIAAAQKFIVRRPD